MISFHINNTTSNDNVSHGLTSKVVEVKMHAVLHAVHGRNPANQLRLVVYPSIYKAFLHPRWFLGISEPSTVSLHFYTLTTFFYLHFTACTELPSMHFFPTSQRSRWERLLRGFDGIYGAPSMGVFFWICGSFRKKGGGVTTALLSVLSFCSL